MSKYKELKLAIDIQNAQLKDFVQKQHAELQNQFSEILLKIFDEYPKLISFSWIQGTPSFCDGDPCYFTIYLHDDNIDYEGFDRSQHSTYVRDGRVTTDWRKNETRPALDIENEYQEVYKDLEYLIYSVPHEVLENLYGDGMEVTVTKKGVVTNEHYMD